MLLDFGLAKGNPTDAGNQTAAKSIFGYSRNYASLEQIQGTGTDPRSDLYSLAATLYHLATNTPPEDALTRAMAVLSHQPDPLVPANAIEPSIPPGVAAILQIAMSLNASSRPASAAEMREMFRDHESFAELASAAAAVASVAASIDVTGQPTKLMPGTTRPVAERQTHIKTQILPEYTSEETSVRDINAGGNATAHPKRRFFLTAGLAALATACLAAGGIYYSQHSAWDASTPEQFVPPGPPAVETKQQAVPGSSALAADSTSVTNSPEAANQQTKTQTPAKTAKTVTASKKKAAIGPGEEVFTGDQIDTGNVKVRNGVIETPDVYIDENGIRRKIPGVRIPQPPIDSPTFRDLTPEQREKLKMLNLKGWKDGRAETDPQQNSTPPFRRRYYLCLFD